MLVWDQSLKSVSVVGFLVDPVKVQEPFFPAAQKDMVQTPAVFQKWTGQKVMAWIQVG